MSLTGGVFWVFVSLGKEPWQVREREGGEVTTAEVRRIEVSRGVHGIPSNRTEIALMRTEFNPDKVRRAVQFPPAPPYMTTPANEFASSGGFLLHVSWLVLAWFRMRPCLIGDPIFHIFGKLAQGLGLLLSRWHHLSAANLRRATSRGLAEGS